MIQRSLLPGVTVVVAGLLLEIAYDVPIADALLYAGYELVFVVAPGWLAYRALSPRPGGPLRQLGLGWALGYVLEILAFMGTAAIGARPLFLAYPLLIAIVAGAVLWARRGTTPSPPDREAPAPPYFGWILASVCLVAIGYITLAYFSTAPLPGTESVSYFVDDPRWISLAADAKDNWPITDPSVAGEPLPYHYFVNVHLAATSQVTGLDLPLIYFRLFIFPLVILTVVLLVVAGRSLANSPYVGLVAAALAFLVGELRLDAGQTFLAHTPFFGLFFTLLFRSPSFLLGLVMFVPLIVLIGEKLRGRDGSGHGSEPPAALAGGWVLLALFMVGASDAKVAILPLVIAALLAYSGWRWLAVRRLSLGALAAAAMATLVAGLVWAMQYRGHPSGLQLDPFGDVNLMPAVRLIKGDLIANLGSFPARDLLLDAGGVAFGLAGLLAAPLIGIAWIARRQRLTLLETQRWLFSLLLVGLLLSLVFAEPGTQAAMYFLFYGLVAGYLLSAEGLRSAWLYRPSMDGKWVPAAALLLVSLALIAGLITLPTTLELFTGSRESALTYMLRYGGLILVLVLLYAAARRWVGTTRWTGAALVSVVLLAVGMLATPFNDLRPALEQKPAAGAALGKSMSPELYDALTWVREETPEDSVIAVNNQWIDENNLVPLEFIYSAFSERRVFLEGWGYSQRVRERGFANVVGGANPFADRLELNQLAFAEGDPRALATLANEYGVRYLIVDLVNGTEADVARLESFGRVAYQAPGVLVIELDETNLPSAALEVDHVPEGAPAS